MGYVQDLLMSEYDTFKKGEYEKFKEITLKEFGCRKVIYLGDNVFMGFNDDGHVYFFTYLRGNPELKLKTKNTEHLRYWLTKENYEQNH